MHLLGLLELFLISSKSMRTLTPLLLTFFKVLFFLKWALIFVSIFLLQVSDFGLSWTKPTPRESAFMFLVNF